VSICIKDAPSRGRVLDHGSDFATRRRFDSGAGKATSDKSARFWAY
jgi:hypothetical protein